MIICFHVHRDNTTTYKTLYVRGGNSRIYDGNNYINDINIFNTILTCNSLCRVRHHIVIFYHYSNYFLQISRVLFESYFRCFGRTWWGFSRNASHAIGLISTFVFQRYSHREWCWSESELQFMIINLPCHYGLDELK